MFNYALLINKMEIINMADVASILAQFEAGIAGKDTGLGATVKFDFEVLDVFFLMEKQAQTL